MRHGFFNSRVLIRITFIWDNMVYPNRPEAPKKRRTIWITLVVRGILRAVEGEDILIENFFRSYPNHYGGGLKEENDSDNILLLKASFLPLKEA